MPHCRTQSLLALFFLLFFHAPSYSQAEDLPIPIFRLSAENGLFFPQNEAFRDFFNSNSSPHWRFGVEFGSTKWKVLPTFKIGLFSFSDSVITAPIGFPDSTITDIYDANVTQFAFGLAFPIKLKNKDHLMIRCSALANRNNTGFGLIREGSTVLELSLGYSRRLNHFLDFTLNTAYSTNRANSDIIPSDWGGFAVNVGLAINLGAIEVE